MFITEFFNSICINSLYFQASPTLFIKSSPKSGNFGFRPICTFKNIH